MDFSQSPSVLPEHLSTPLEFNYNNLDTETRMVVEQRTSEIKNLMRRTTEDIIEIGQKLTDVKVQLGHGSFRNWLKAEFDWSIQTANRFMQVADKFKSPNLLHLDIAPSALYLLASPSTSEQARAEALQRASLGENITYSKARLIVTQHKKAAKLKDALPVNFDLPTATFGFESNKFIKLEHDEALGKQESLLQLNGKEVQTKTRLELSQDSLSFSVSKDKKCINNVERTIEQIDDILLTSSRMINQHGVCSKISNTIIQIEIEIKKLTPEQLALVIINSAKNGLSTSHLQAIIIAAEQALHQAIEVKCSH